MATMHPSAPHSASARVLRLRLPVLLISMSVGACAKGGAGGSTAPRRVAPRDDLPRLGPPRRRARRQPAKPRCGAGGALRGQIQDRKGRVLVENQERFHIYIRPRDFRATRLPYLARRLGLDATKVSYVRETILKRTGQARNRFWLAVSGLTPAQRRKLTYGPPLPGVQFRREWIRRYPQGNVGAHALGYLNEVTAAELKTWPTYLSGDKVGRRGLEKAFERTLRAWAVKGRPAAGSTVASPMTCTAGHHVVSTLDLDLQRAAAQALGTQRGAVVVLEAATGRIRALVSRPHFDLPAYAGRLPVATLRRLQSRPDHPLLDRTVDGAFMPGAPWLVVPALAALAKPTGLPKQVTCQGHRPFGKRSYRCHARHGAVGLEGALTRACRSYFYGVGNHLGIDVLARWGRQFGLGRRTGLGLGSERAGVVPDRAWYRKNSPTPFRLVHTLGVAVGRGDLLVTPLQLALLYGAVATDGALREPRLVERIERSSGGVAQTLAPKLVRQIKAPAARWQRIRRALRAAVADPAGVANGAAVPGLAVAGLAGTVPLRRAERRSLPAPHKDHDWFAGYAPADKPTLVVVVLVEGGGPHSAAPLARSIFGVALRPGPIASR